MGLIWLKQFSAGLDTRRPPLVAGQETLTRADDVHVTSAGDLEQRADFLAVYAGHPGVIGYVSNFDKLYAVGLRAADAPEMSWNGVRPTGLPGVYGYLALPLVDGSRPSEIVSAQRKGGRAFFVVKYANGATRLRAAPKVGSSLVEAPAFAPIVTPPESGDAPAVIYVHIPGDFRLGTIAQVTGYLRAKGYSEPLAEQVVSAQEKLILVRSVYVRIKDFRDLLPLTGNDLPEVLETGAGVKRIYHKNEAGDFVEGQVAGTPANQFNTVHYYSATIAYVPLAASGFYEEAVDDTPVEGPTEADYPPSAVHAAARKLIFASGQTLLFSGLSSPLAFQSDIPVTSPNPGAGFIDASSEIDGSLSITGLAKYGEKLAVFFSAETQIWSLDVDLGNSKLSQTILGGTDHPKSIVSTAADTFYVDRTGVRSLRARDSSGTLIVDDAGTPVNRDVINAVRSAGRVVAGLDPESGRVLFAIGDQIFVLAAYPGQNLAAWTRYLPGFVIQDFIRHGARLFIQGPGGSLYAYGSATDEQVYRYTQARPVVHLPWLDANDPASEKTSTSLDAAVEGAWRISVAMSPRDPDAQDVVAEIDGPTYDVGTIGMTGGWNHLQLRFECTASKSATEPARLSSAMVHFVGKADAK